MSEPDVLDFGGDWFADADDACGTDEPSHCVDVSATQVGGTEVWPPVASWSRSHCEQWLRSLGEGVVIPEEEEGLCGAALLAAVHDVREMKQTFGLKTIEARCRFTTALKRAGLVHEGPAERPTSSAGGLVCVPDLI